MIEGASFMNPETESDNRRFRVARFPSTGLCREFLEIVRLWNRIEDLQDIEAEPLNNGVSVRLRLAGMEDRGIRRLIDSLGGTILPSALGGARCGWLAR